MYKILIVEDDEVICEQVQKHLVRWGYEAIGVKDKWLYSELSINE